MSLSRSTYPNKYLSPFSINIVIHGNNDNTYTRIIVDLRNVFINRNLPTIKIFLSHTVQNLNVKKK